MANDLFTHLPALHRKVGSKEARSLGTDARRLLIMGSQGFEGDAVVACVSLRMWMSHCSCHEGLTHLLGQDSTFVVSHQLPGTGNCCLFLEIS